VDGEDWRPSRAIEPVEFYAVTVEDGEFDGAEGEARSVVEFAAERRDAMRVEILPVSLRRMESFKGVDLSV
jgi:hypothetical protein